MFPPTVWHCNTKEEEEKYILLGQEPGENELIAIPDKTFKQYPNPTVYIPLCVPFILPIQTPHRKYVQDTQKCMG